MVRPDAEFDIDHDLACGDPVLDRGMGVGHLSELEAVGSRMGATLPASASFAASRRISPWCALPCPVSIGSSVKTPEYVAARNDSGASACVPQPRQLTTCPNRFTTLKEASSTGPPSVL
jgi:hypothetical protein